MKAPRVILTIGVSGSGKTTYIEKNCSEVSYFVLCPDKLRGIIGTSEGDQTVNHKVFNTLFTFLTYLLRFGQRDIIIDATSYCPKNRKEIIAIARKEGSAGVEALCFDIPLEVAKARNSLRERKVPEDVIQRQFDNLTFPGLDEVDACFKIDVAGNSEKVFDNTEKAPLS